MKKEKRGILSCINGVKGAISLFLAVLMTPFLTIAVMLVEIGRYNSAVSILDEALGVSSISTLANYDDYLQERWGLLALSQDIDVDSVYQQNLQTNGSIMGGAININSARTNGMYPLSDPNILCNQIMEYSKLNVPTVLATEFGNLSDWVKKLENLTGLGNVVSLLTKGVDALDSGVTLVESAEKLKESANKLDGYRNDYENKYVAFESAINTLIDNLQVKKNLEDQLTVLRSELAVLEAELDTLLAEDEKEEEETEEAEEDEKVEEEDSEEETESEEVKAKREEIAAKNTQIRNVNGQIRAINATISSNRTSAKTAQSNYAQTLLDIATELKNFRTLMAACDEAIDRIQSDIMGAAADVAAIMTDLENKKKDLAALQAELKRMEKEGYTESDPAYSAGLDYKIALEKELAELETEKALCDATSKGLGEMGDSWDTSFEAYSDATLGETITGFENLRAKVLELNVDAISANSADITRESYKHIALAGYINAADIDKYLKDQEEKLKNGSLKAIIDGLTAIYNQLMGLTIFFEDNLNGCIDVQYYNENFGGLPGGANADGGLLEVIENIGVICASAGSAALNFMQWNLWTMLTELMNLGKALIDLFLSIGQLAVDLLRNIADLLTGYDKWYYSAYAAYNLSCRTDFNAVTGSTSIKNITGYTAGSNSFPEEQNTINVPVFGELSALVNTLVTYMTDTGKDITFSGAELEYIMFGSSSELANQLYVFCVLYLMRLLCNIPNLTANAEVQGLAASATLGYPVVMGLYIILEPLVQTILLVNGREQALVPATVYLAPSGLPMLIEDLLKFCKLTDAQKENIEGKMVTAFSKSQGDYDYQKTLAEYDTEGDVQKALFDLDYREYCFLVLLLTVTESQFMARLSNVIQMETLYYYQQQEATFTFDLKKSYSFLHVQVDASLNQMMPSLADSSLFSIDREHYRGY